MSVNAMNNAVLGAASTKGLRVSFQSEGAAVFDFDLIDTILDGLASAATNPTIKDRLKALRDGGTDAHKVAFFLSEGTYYFPEDIEEMARLSRGFTGGSPHVEGLCSWAYEILETTVCRAVPGGIAGEVICRVVIKQIKTWVCP